MNLLLDTHAFLWFLADDASLSARARELITGNTNTIFVSLISGWEIAVKQKLGKLTFPEPFDEAFQTGCDANGFEILTLSVEQLGQTLRLPLHHRDPFDRLLVAQCQISGLDLVSRDERLDAYAIRRRW